MSIQNADVPAAVNQQINTTPMDLRFLRPSIFEALPSQVGSDKLWVHWKRTFQSFLSSINPEPTPEKKLDILVIRVSAAVYEYISEYVDYTAALQVLE